MKLLPNQDAALNSSFNIEARSYNTVSQGNPKSDENPYHSVLIAQCVLITAIGGFFFGYDTGVISGVQLFFKDAWPDIEETQREMIVSNVLLGAAVGSLFYCTLSDKVSRKPLILMADFLFTSDAVMMAWALSIAF